MEWLIAKLPSQCGSQQSPDPDSSSVNYQTLCRPRGRHRAFLFLKAYDGAEEALPLLIEGGVVTNGQFNCNLPKCGTTVTH